MHLKEIFRIVHTLRPTLDFFYSTELSQMAMDLENDLYQVEQNKVVPTGMDAKLFLFLKTLKANSTHSSSVHSLEQNIIQFAEKTALKLAKKIKLNFECQVRVMSNDEINMLWIIFTHLIANAIDHGIDSVGVISIRVEQKQDQIRISFSDNGKGINEAIRDKIFQEGFSTQSTQISGRGLGLAIVKDLVNSKQGKIEYKQSNGNGGSFEIVFFL